MQRNKMILEYAKKSAALIVLTKAAL